MAAASTPNPVAPDAAPTTGTTGTASTSAPATTTWPPVPSSLAPTGTPASLLDGLSTQPDPNSPTGGVVTSTNQIQVADPSQVGRGVDTSASALLPKGVTAAQIGPQRDVSLPSVQSVIQQGTDAQVGPTDWTVTPDQTVAGQYATLMSKGNPAIQAAEQATIRAYSAAGGNNSLMAQNAASMSGSQVALTIAQQDAQTFAAAGKYNADEANQFAQSLNQFADNALLSRQNYDQGVAMLQEQTNQQLAIIAANVQATAETTSIQLAAAAKTAQINLQSTTQTMLMQASVNAAASSQQYAQNVSLGYLSDVSQQQAALMGTIGMIQSNPNITSAQAQGAVSDAINQFNTFVSQTGAIASALMPGSGNTTTASTPAGTTTTAANDATYNTPAYNYNRIAANFPNPTPQPAPAPAPASTGMLGGTVADRNIQGRARL